MIKKNQKGVSMVSLVITIIVIIILAVVAFVSSRDSVKRAGFSKYVTTMGDLQEIIDTEYRNLSGTLEANRESFRQKEIYYMVATGRKLDDTSEIQENEEKLISLGKIYPGLPKGTYYYEITDEERIRTLKKAGQFSEEQTYFITDKGEVFSLPGYDMTQDEGNRWYINSERYYESFEPVLTGGGINVWNGNNDTFWYTQEEQQLEYTIYTAEELAGIAELVNSGTDNFAGKSIYLGANIDLNNIEWTPIGESESHPFRGNFYGNGKTISNLKITDCTNAGLFGYLKNNTVKYLGGIEDLTIRNVTITGAVNAAAFLGDGKFASGNEWRGGIIQLNNLKLTGTVRIEGDNAGAIVGSSWLGSRINATNIEVKVDSSSYIKGEKVAGGVFASSPHTGGQGSKASNIYSNIAVKCSGIVGGIAGKAGWIWDNIVYAGKVTLNVENIGDKYSIGTIFGQIADNPYWFSYVDIIGMTNLNDENTFLEIKSGDVIVSENNGTDNNLFPAEGAWGGLFKYENNKVVESK